MSAGRLTGLALIALSVLAAAATNAAAAPLPEAAQTVADCTRQADRLLVVIEIDSSASLHSSDPEDRRVDGVAAALLGLTDLVERADWEEPPPRVDVLLSSFAGSVQPPHPGRAWRPVEASTRGRLRAEAQRYAGRDHGRDTDYVLAFEAARSALNQRAAAVRAAGAPAPCKVILFLSDGGYRLGDRTGAAHLPSSVHYAPGVNLERSGAGAEAVAIGRQLLCRRNGLMDRIQADGTVLFTVALTGPKFSALDRARLAAMTTGEAGEARCGSRLSEQSGEFVEARDSQELFFIFRDLFDPEGPPICNPCPNPSRFLAEPGMRGFVLSATPEEGVELELTDPAGESETFSSGGTGDVSLGGATIDQEWINGRVMEIRADFDPRESEWQGVWKLQFYAPGETLVPTYKLSFLSDLRPELVGEPQLRAGATKTVRIDLVDFAGDPVRGEGLVQFARLRAEIVDGAGDSHRAEVTRSGPGSFEVPVWVPADTTDGSWTLRAETYFPDRVRRVEGSTVGLDLGPPEIPGGKFPWELLVAAIVVALLVAAAVEHRMRTRRAQFVRPRQLRVFRAKATVVPGVRVILEPDRPEGLAYGDSKHLAYGDFEHLELPGDGTEVTAIPSGPLSIRARVPGLPTRPPVGIASAKDRLLLGGNLEGPMRTPDDHRTCEVPLALSGTWLFAFEPPEGEEEVRGHLSVFTDEEAPRGLGDEVLEAARSALLEQDWEEFRRRPDDDDGDPLLDIDEIDWKSI